MLGVPEAFDQNNAEQRSALQCLEQTSMSLFLTGSAGTGKSYFLQHYCEVTHKKFVKLAPTGLAALNIHGQTIHSFFRLPLAPLTDANHTSAITRRYRKDKRELIRQLDLIIIDEISMVRCDLLDAMVAQTDTRYLIVSHNAVTMARMHRLFGVTMVEQGVSRLVSVNLGGAEALLAAE